MTCGWWSAILEYADSETGLSVTYNLFLPAGYDASKSYPLVVFEVMGMFQADNVPFASAQWDGAWTPDELSSAANDLFANGSDANFVSWTSGSIEANSGMGGAGVHMASFDYAYNCIAVMEWLFQQVR